MTVKAWQLRINELDASKGVSNKMIQSCMQAEIVDLHKALKAQAEVHVRLMKAQERKLTTQIERQKKLVQQAKERAKVWREHATRYQSIIGELRKK